MRRVLRWLFGFRLDDVEAEVQRLKGRCARLEGRVLTLTRAVYRLVPKPATEDEDDGDGEDEDYDTGPGAARRALGLD